MGCPNQVYVGDYLGFSICTHDPETGLLTDADSAPAYRVYEDANATPLLTGTVSKLDDAATTGFYVAVIACTTANGFRHGHTYSVYIEATVDGYTGGIAYGFKADTNTALAVASQAGAPSSSSLAITARATYTVTFSGLVIAAAWAKIWFTIKRALGDADADSVVQVVVSNPGAPTDGLLYQNGAAATAARASLAIDQSGGYALLTITDEATVDLSPDEGLSFDLKQLEGSVTTVLHSGKASIAYTPTAAIV